MKRLSIIICILVFTSCSNKVDQIDDSSIEVVELRPSTKEFPFSEIFKPTYEIIKLESNENSVIKHMGKVEFYDNRILIHDPTSMNLLMFNRDGTFIKKLEHKGKGPKEYIRLASFSFQKNEGLIHIFDDTKRKIMTYNMDFEFVKSRDLPFSVLGFEVLENGHFAFYRALMPSEEKEYNFDLIITDPNINIERQYFPIELEKAGRGYAGITFEAPNGKRIFHTNYSNIVYQFDAEELEPKYKMDFQTHQLPPNEFYANISANNGSKDINNSDFIYSYRYFEVNNKIVVSYFADKQHFFAISSEKKNLLFVNKLKDDFGFFLNNGYPSFQHGNKLGFFVYPYIFLDRQAKKS